MILLIAKTQLPLVRRGATEELAPSGAASRSSAERKRGRHNLSADESGLTAASADERLWLNPLNSTN